MYIFDIVIDELDDPSIITQHPICNFVTSYMNVMHPIKSDCNIAGHVTEQDCELIKHVFKKGYQCFSDAMQTCNGVSPEKYSKLDFGNGIATDIGSYFISTCLQHSRNRVIELQTKAKCSLVVSPSEQQIKLSKQFCDQEPPEQVIRHAELIMGSKVSIITSYD